jgi:beta-N-acetylhexosaminidase
MGGVPADGLTTAARAAVAGGAGGIILTDAAGGGEVSTGAVSGTVRAAQAAADVPLLVSTDQEGGRVQDLAGAGFTRIPSAAVQARDGAGLRADAAGWGRELAAAGVGLDLAPVADVVDPALGKDNAPVGALDRGYGTDPDVVGPSVAAFVGGMGQSGVATTLKHFPGLGQVRQNTDFAGTVVDTTTTRDDPGLASFRAGIAAGAGAVMVSSARYTRIDPENPALFSRTIVTDVLRGDLGFGGVVMTDDVGAAAALADVRVGQRAVRFVAAGGDLVLTVRPGDVAPMVDALVAAADDPAFAARLDESARRVLTLKSDRSLLRC